MNEFLTAYLYGLHTLRRGRLSASDAMSHVLDLMAAAQRTRAAVEGLMGFGGRVASAPTAGGRETD